MEILPGGRRFGQWTRLRELDRGLNGRRRLAREPGDSRLVHKSLLEQTIAKKPDWVAREPRLGFFAAPILHRVAGEMAGEAVAGRDDETRTLPGPGSPRCRRDGIVDCERV